MGTEKPKTNFKKNFFFAIYFEIAFVLETTKGLKTLFCEVVSGLKSFSCSSDSRSWDRGEFFITFLSNSTVLSRLWQIINLIEVDYIQPLKVEFLSMDVY